MMNRLEEYFGKIKQLLERIETTQKEPMEKAARMGAEVIARGGVIHFFGCGHSHILCEEVFYRAGGLAPVNPLFAPEVMLHHGAVKHTKMERMEGLAEAILENYDTRQGELIFVISTSGRNAVPVEMAIKAREKGLIVAAVTSLAYSSKTRSRHSSGKHLYEVADIVIDNCVDFGDALLDYGDLKAVPGSTVAGAAVLNGIIARIIELLTEEGIDPPVFISGNIDGADERNIKTLKRYKNRIKGF
jgi:uncharacterized phosphosugar-binding protein